MHARCVIKALAHTMSFAVFGLVCEVVFKDAPFRILHEGRSYEFCFAYFEVSFASSTDPNRYV
jgi:hypothetical protein